MKRTRLRSSKRTLARRRRYMILDKAAKSRVFERDRSICQRCGVPATEWSHVFTREYRRTRWEDDNALAQCKPCEAFASYHRDRWLAWVQKTWPERFERMRVLVESGQTYKDFQITEMAEAING